MAKQVMFIFKENHEPVDIPMGGILINDKIICGHCGEIVDIDDVLILSEFPWVSISEEILGN